MWEMVDAKDEAATTIVTLKLIDTKDYECELYATFEIGKELKMHLKTINVGEDEVKITQALHTYFSISDIKNISISGLENKPYLDQLDATTKVQNSTITIDKEVDRIYLDVDKPIVLNDSDAKTKITTKNSSSCIVWNPWIEKAKSMGDMDDDGYKKFVCIESANALDDFVVLKEGQTHTLSVSIKVV
ncbi:MAG: hypothetical protein JXQ66_06935 [Campylobacterales bacterium]|nr:hypothetical protein [Campylobacterales bacterium]